MAFLEACRRPPALEASARTEASARNVRIAFEAQKLLERDGLEAVLKLVQDYFASDPMDAAYQDMAQFLRFRKLAQPVDGYSTKCDLL